MAGVAAREHAVDPTHVGADLSGGEAAVVAPAAHDRAAALEVLEISIPRGAVFSADVALVHRVVHHPGAQLPAVPPFEIDVASVGDPAWRVDLSGLACGLRSFAILFVFDQGFS